VGGLNRKTMKDDLSRLLREWNPSAPEPPGFRHQVWQRIEAAAAKSSSREDRLGKWLFFFAHPWGAVAALAIALTLGALAGESLSASDGRQAYLRSVNPYAHPETHLSTSNF